MGNSYQASSKNPDFYLGFDPGGQGAFGWCVLEEFKNRIIRYSGTSYNLDQTLSQIKFKLNDFIPVSAGIDAPLYWPLRGSRQVDDALKKCLINNKYPYPHGTVQHINSLRGACLAQGIMLAHELRKLWPSIPLTEAHPKAYIHGFNLWSNDERQLNINSSTMTEHERDAIASAVAAMAMAKKDPLWEDKSKYEITSDMFHPVPVPYPQYWLPK